MPILPSRLLAVLALSAACLAPALLAQTPPAAAPQPQSPNSPINPQAESKVIASLESRNFDAALAGADTILATHPDSAKANKLVGVILLDQQKSSAALPYFQKALQLGPDDPTVHGLLLQAYAQSGDKADRDAQRAILRGYHNDGKHPEFAQIPSYLIETIPVGDKIIQANEFYEPSGEFHFYYRFNVFDTAGHIQRYIALESDDADQALYAQKHPRQAARGQRRFSLDGYSRTNDGHLTQVLYTFYDGKPTYDTLRALVIKLVESGKAPALAATTRASN